jgi:hypothetical protein
MQLLQFRLQPRHLYDWGDCRATTRGANWIIELEKTPPCQSYQARPCGLQASPLPDQLSKGIMDTALERIQAKIAELETKIVNLRIAERELVALDKISAQPARTVPETKPKQKPGPKPTLRPKLKGKPKASGGGEARQTSGAAIVEILDRHGALSAAEIAEHIRATGRDINNRTVSFTLQALKKRGLAKNTDGKWAPPKARARRAPSLSGAGAQETETVA